MRKAYFMVFMAAFAVLAMIVPAAAETKEFTTEHFTLTISTDKLGIKVNDSAGEPMLEHAAGGGVYVADDNEKTFLEKCDVSESTENRLGLECRAGGDTFDVYVNIENEYEFSLKLRAREDIGDGRMGHRFSLPAGESIYGLKEHVEGDGKGGTDKGTVQKYATLDQRGMTVEMYTRPTISIYSPFHINSRGYGLFFDTSWPGMYDLGDTEHEVADISFEGSSLPMYFTVGPRMGDIIERHTDRVGKSVLPPRWAAEVFKWRDDHLNLHVLFDGSMNPSPFNSMVYEDIMMLRKLKIPTGVYWLDRPWAKGPFGYDDFEFDTLRFPKPAEMIKWLKEKNGMETLLWVAPWAYGDMRDVAREKGYLAPNSEKVIDLTNPEAVEWWQGEFKKMFDLDVAGFKLDRCEEVIPSGRGDIYHNGKTGREMHNLYPMLYAKAVHGACRKFRGDDCLVMPRSGFTGSQKYAVFWGGDTHPSWRGLRSVLISCLRSNIMGFPVWGSDTGGYGTPQSQDIFSRWLQVSAFHPIMEIGGSGPHEPWNAGYEPQYDETGIRNYRFYAKLHTELVPYNYSYMYHAHKTGRPIVRPLTYHWPEDVRVRDMWDEFMFGEWILAAPVIEEGARVREVYLPEGTWYDFWYPGNVLEGPKNFRVDAPIDRIPVFIREGAIIPLEIMDSETGFGDSFAHGEFTIAMYPSENETSFTLYDGGKEIVLKQEAAEDSVRIDTTGLDRPALLRVRQSGITDVTFEGRELRRYRQDENFQEAEEGWIRVPNERLLWIKTASGGEFLLESKSRR